MVRIADQLRVGTWKDASTMSRARGTDAGHHDVRMAGSESRGVWRGVAGRAENEIGRQMVGAPPSERQPSVSTHALTRWSSVGFADRGIIFRFRDLFLSGRSVPDRGISPFPGFRKMKRDRLVDGGSTMPAPFWTCDRRLWLAIVDQKMCRAGWPRRIHCPHFIDALTGP